jgi:hypothetical protein
MIQEEPSFASKIVKIAHQQTFGLLLANSYCLVFELSDFTQNFNYIWSYRIAIQARLVSLES